MTAPVDFGYAQARIQAQLARLPSEADWERLGASRGLASFLEDARAGGLRDWLKGFSGQTQAQDLERGLRGLFSERVEQVARWAPRRWRDGIGWIAWLPLLPLLERLSRGGSIPSWAAQDARFGACVDDAGQLDPSRLEHAGLARLLGALEGEAAGALWLAGWRDRWPPMRPGPRARMESLADLVKAHLAAFRRADAHAAWRLRATLRGALRLRLHLYPLEPVTVFAFLGLVLLDLERLRAELLRRALFAEAQAA